MMRNFRCTNDFEMRRKPVWLVEKVQGCIGDFHNKHIIQKLIRPPLCPDVAPIMWTGKKVLELSEVLCHARVIEPRPYDTSEMFSRETK